MLHVSVLGSGSAGNCALVETPETRLLIDGGLSARQIDAAAAQCGMNPIEIDGILLTHEHGDHVCGLDVWCKQFATPIYCNRADRRSRCSASAPELRKDWHYFVTGSAVPDQGHRRSRLFRCRTMRSSRSGSFFIMARAALGLLTDLGFATKLVYRAGAAGAYA